MIPWDEHVEGRARALAEAIVAGGPGAATAWRGLMALLAPHIEAWARANRLLRRCRLAGEDDARAVMVDVFERLAARDHANLRAMVARDAGPVDVSDPLVVELERLGRLADDGESEVERPAAATPTRAWLLRLVDFAARGHVRRRFGWTERDDGGSKRDLHTDAAPLDAAPEVGERPPVTDRLTVARLVAEVRDHMASFPEPMRRALLLWLEDHGFDEIAAALGLPDPERARALVRAGQARLRERFRGRAPLFAA